MESQEVTPGLEVRNYRRGVLEETIGRLNALPTNVILGTPKAIWQKVPDITEYLKEKYKDVPWKGNVEVHLNRSPLFRQLRRLFQKERQSNLFVRSTIGLATTLNAWVYGKLARGDLYNPFTETAQIFHSNPAVAMHEVGHAVDYNQRKYPSLYALSRAIPPLAILQEWRASRNAMKHLDPQEQDKAKKILEPAWGTYIGAPFTPLSPFAKWLPTVAGAAAGHIHSRVTRKNVFYNEKTA